MTVSGAVACYMLDRPTGVPIVEPLFSYDARANDGGQLERAAQLLCALGAGLRVLCTAATIAAPPAGHDHDDDADDGDDGGYYAAALSLAT